MRFPRQMLNPQSVVEKEFSDSQRNTGINGSTYAHKCTLKGNTVRRKADTIKKMSTWLNVAKINSQEEETVSNELKTKTQTKKQKAQFSKPRTNYCDRSKLP